MNLIYVYNGQPVGHGERSFVYSEDGTLSVRTGVQSITKGQIIYTLREVYDKDKVVEPPVNQPPVAGPVDITFEVEPKK
jgi:hypothetical protein